MKDKDGLYTKLAIGVGVYFFVLRPILQKLGVSKTKEDRIVEAVESLPNNTNPFSPQFWQQAPAGATKLDLETAARYAARIYYAMGTFTDDEGEIYSVFRSLKTQGQVSYVAGLFQQNYGTDMLEYLKRGANQYNPGSGLNADELAVVINIVSKLPKYKA